MQSRKNVSELCESKVGWSESGIEDARAIIKILSKMRFRQVNKILEKVSKEVNSESR